MTWLVIGIGNTLRRDDGIGPWLAGLIESWNLSGVAVRVVHQLTPELASEMAAFDRVLFVDAGVSRESWLREISADAQAPLGHALSPTQLLALAESLGRGPLAWQAVIAAGDFAFGEGLSVSARAECERMLPAIGRLLREGSECMKSG